MFWAVLYSVFGFCGEELRALDVGMNGYDIVFSLQPLVLAHVVTLGHRV
jgi:hypothetical protein